jgi:hypothetical protein
MHHNCFGAFKPLFQRGFSFFPKWIFLGDASTLSFCSLGLFELFKSKLELELNDDNFISSIFFFPLGLLLFFAHLDLVLEANVEFLPLNPFLPSHH